MSAFRIPLGLAAAAYVVGSAAVAAAATKTTSFGVSVTVVSTCSLVTGGAQPRCAAQTRGAPAAIVAPQPVVRVTKDAKTGATVQTIEF